MSTCVSTPIDFTGTDAEYLDSANSLSDPPPRTTHLIAAEPRGD